MASKTPNTIYLKGDPQGREGLATQAIIPGQLVRIAPVAAPNVSDGRLLGVSLHSAGKTSQMAVAREADIFGKSIDDAYAKDDTVLYNEFRKGDMFYGFLAAAGKVVVGDQLASNEDGSFKLATADDAIIAVATEAVDNTGGASQVRLKVEVI